MTTGDFDKLQTELEGMYEARSRELRERWNRDLPFQDAMFDRWDRASQLGFGASASIYNSALVLGEVAVGESTWVGPYTVLDGSGGQLQIGAFCSISTGVQIYTHDTIAWSISLGARERSVAPVRIGDGCHLGAGSTVLAGANIGDMCVIGAGSVVKGDVPTRSVVAGSPARLIGQVDGNGTNATVAIFSRQETNARDERTS